MREQSWPPNFNMVSQCQQWTHYYARVKRRGEDYWNMLNGDKDYWMLLQVFNIILSCSRS